MPQIFFSPTENDTHYILPSPAINALPDWYKKASPYIDDDTKYKMTRNGPPNFTFKKCSPILDSLGMGYLLHAPIDLYVDADETNFFRLQWRAAFEYPYVTEHSLNQTVDIPYDRQYFCSQAFKFDNPYVIRTKPGYSCLFVHPFHRYELPFMVIPGVVDTDRYKLPIHFPFLLRKNFTGMIPSGTPIVQIIPFKRESWRMKNTPFMDTRKDRHEFFRKAHSYYRHFVWVRKDYR